MTNPPTRNQPADELDQILDTFNPLNTSLNDFIQQVKPEAKVALQARTDRLVREAYKKGFIDSGIKMTQRNHIVSAPDTEIETLALQMWEGMFGDAVNAKAENCTVNYKDFIASLVALLATSTQQAVEEAVIAYRDKNSTQGRPLSAEPLLVDMPACNGCGSTKYADWTLWPHQLYNSISPDGVGSWCFPCFAKKASGTQQAMIEKLEKILERAYHPHDTSYEFSLEDAVRKELAELKAQLKGGSDV